ncbi:MAG: hypothetical protein ABSH32_12410 [Bryobacteraceae bacterium]|jgi:hypothetical protein
MKLDQTIRHMTREERQAKRDWGTGACQVRQCTARAAYLAMQSWEDGSKSGEWWQYCCPKHAKRFAEQHGIEMPAAPTAAKSVVV